MIHNDEEIVFIECQNRPKKQEIKKKSADVKQDIKANQPNEFIRLRDSDLAHEASID